MGLDAGSSLGGYRLLLVNYSLCALFGSPAKLATFLVLFDRGSCSTNGGDSGIFHSRLGYLVASVGLGAAAGALDCGAAIAKEISAGAYGIADRVRGDSGGDADHYYFTGVTPLKGRD